MDYRNKLKNPKIDSAEEDFPEKEVNLRVKMKREIIPSKPEASPETDFIIPHRDKSYNASSPCIFRTPFIELQEPKLVSIGPYHRGKKNLPLDKHKYSFLEKFLSRARNEGKALCSYVGLMMKLEHRTRGCYSEDLSMSSPDFVEMMLVDACFLIEVLRHFGRNEESVDGVPLLPIEPWQIPILLQDLLMLENQIPFFLLTKLLSLSDESENLILADCEELTATTSVITMALKFFDLAFPLSLDLTWKFYHLKAPKHLLELFLETIRPSNSNPSTNSPSLFPRAFILMKRTRVLFFLAKLTRALSDSVLYLILKKFTGRRNQMRVPEITDGNATSSKQKVYRPFMQSKPSTSERAKSKRVYLSERAWELQQSGIEFRPRRADRFTDIHFKDGVLGIPSVTVNNLFIQILFNCVALEQCSTGCSKDLTAYASFMSSLIRYPPDVECLCSNGIISRFSSNNEEVASYFGSLWVKIYNSNFDIIQDSCLYKTAMETERYYTGDAYYRLVQFFRDPRTFLFCITSLLYFLLFKVGCFFYESR